MPAGSSQAHQQPVAYDERRLPLRILIERRHVDMPTRKILAVEEALRFRFLGGKYVENVELGKRQRSDDE
jgi:hypothetical protein